MYPEEENWRSSNKKGGNDRENKRISRLIGPLQEEGDIYVGVMSKKPTRTVRRTKKKNEKGSANDSLVLIC